MTIVKTRWGSVEGRHGKRAIEFLGLPYAEPPVGDQRWLPPQPVQNMPKNFDATKYGNRIYQPPYPEILGEAPSPGDLSEDCLYLNIYTPGTDKKSRPVMVWIHGGGFMQGSGNDFDGSALASENDVVVVCVNYRLAIFGFLDLSQFGDRYAGSASLGFQDQIAALAWIRDHISDFGGDPDNVTIFGESAGGASVMALLSAPSADGLFHKAIALSPGPVNYPPQNGVAVLAKHFEIDEEQVLEKLLALDGETLAVIQFEAGAIFTGSVDGTIVTRPTYQAVAERDKASIPLITGTTADEGTLLGPLMDYQAALAVIPREIVLSEDTKSYVEFIETSREQQHDRLEKIIFDMFRSNVLRVAQSANNEMVWVYSFVMPSTTNGGVLRATHGSTGPFNFNAYGADIEMLCKFHDPADPAVLELSESWSTTLCQFARTGDPNGGGLPNWPSYNSDTRSCLMLDRHPHVTSDPDREDENWYGFQPSDQGSV